MSQTSAEMLADAINELIDCKIEHNNEIVIGKFNSGDFIEVFNKLHFSNVNINNYPEWKIVVYLCDSTDIPELDLIHVVNNTEVEYIPAGGKVEVSILHAETVEKMRQQNLKNKNNDERIKYPCLMTTV